LKRVKNMTIILLLIISASFIFGIRVSDPEKILSVYSGEDIKQIFIEGRMFEWIDKFEVKEEGIFLLSGKWYYKVMMEEDQTLFFSGLQSRYDYDRNQVSWLFISIFIVSGGIILFIILTSIKWHGFRWYKKLKNID